MKVKLISVTPDAEKIIGYCARVSNPKNQDNPDVSKLLSYCIKHKHWSIFEMGNLVVEVTTSRAIAQQILRHRSFSFQEFSQRYAQATEVEPIEIRRQDEKNRQNSIDDLDENTKIWFTTVTEHLNKRAFEVYESALSRGIAKECARMILPLTTQTKLYINGTIRSWITYLLVRMEKGTQKEHRDVAIEIWKIFKKEFSIISEALKNYDEVFLVNG